MKSEKTPTNCTPCTLECCLPIFLEGTLIGASLVVVFVLFTVL